LKTLKKIPKPAAKFLVLIPHRDSLVCMEDFRQKLFTAGFRGAYSFPAAAPLATLSRSLTRDELREIGRRIRTAVNGGMICSGAMDELNLKIQGVDFFDDVSFFGPALDLPPLRQIVGIGNEQVIEVLPSAVLCAGILRAGDLGGGGLGEVDLKKIAEFPTINFRAAMITNLTVRPLAGGSAASYSYEWRLGPECWLPRAARCIDI